MITVLRRERNACHVIIAQNVGFTLVADFDFLRSISIPILVSLKLLQLLGGSESRE